MIEQSVSLVKKVVTYVGDFFLCTLLAPIGMLRIVHRQFQRKQQFNKGGGKLLALSVIFFILFGILISDPTTITNPFTYMYGVAGIGAVIFGVLMILRGAKYDKYKSAVENHNLLTVKSIADMIKETDDVVIKDLLQMIKDGFFPDFRYDAAAKTLRLNNFAITKKRSKAIECDNCGAKVTVFEGDQNKCEYCGSALNY